MHKQLFQTDEFSNPSAQWRGKPFWSWNGKLQKEELIRQIHVLKEMGMGGYFMHSRTGLVTEYLGKEWFELTNACAEEGERLGMESWLYDEDRWPSGTAGGLVTANPDYRMKFIHMEIFNGDTFDFSAWESAQDRPLGAWSCRLENKIDLYDTTPVTTTTSANQLRGKTVLAFRVLPMANGSFYNGNTYVDTMKREATDEYIRLTHEAYKKHCGHHFGTSIKGIFTDEPHRGAFMSGFGMPHMDGVDDTYLIPWTDELFDKFLAMHGIRVEDHLPELFLREDGNPVTQLKAQYAETMLRLFLDNFMHPYYEWCEKHDLLATGHVLHENSLSAQVSTNGSMQRCYPLMHIPGIDYLGEHGRDYWVAKQVDSTARQFGQKWILSELYGCTGWQMNFEAHKAIGAWQALFGVNLRCHHLSWYTMAGESKRDYPASILHQSPWYKEYDTVETWFSRLGYFRAQGTPCCDLLVLNPVESVWGRVYPKAISGMEAMDPEIKELEKKYAGCFHILAGNHIDFDYGDEGLLAEHGSFSTCNGKPVLQLGAMKYSTVLIAGADTIRGSTLSLLKKFSAAGGKVIVAGTIPSYVDFKKSEDMKSLSFEHCDFTENAIVNALENHTPHRVRITDSLTGETVRDVFCQLRKAADGYYLTILNTDRKNERKVEISLSGVDGEIVEEWNLESGKAYQLPASRKDTLTFSAKLHTSQARCFRIVLKSSLPKADAGRNVHSEAKPVILDQPARYTLADRNICVLDTPAWSLNGGVDQPVNDIMKIDQQVREQLGVPRRAGDMVQPWFRGKQAFPALGQLALRYALKIDEAGRQALANAELAIETPDRFTVTINGTPVDTSRDNGWWVDVAFRRIAIPAGILHEGENEIQITCTFSEDINLEAIYLLGDFAVALNGTTPCLSPLPATLVPSSIVNQGLPYYSGSITYHYDIPPELNGRQCMILVPAYEGAYIRAGSGGEMIMIPWRPNEAEVKLRDTLDIEVCITRKNTFGPLHLKNPRPSHTGPGHFVPGPNDFSLVPVFLDAGLLAPVTLSTILDLEAIKGKEGNS